MRRIVASPARKFAHMRSKRFAKKRELSHSEVETSIKPNDKRKKVTINSELSHYEEEPSIKPDAKRKKVTKNNEISHYEEEPSIKPDAKRKKVAKNNEISHYEEEHSIKPDAKRKKVAKNNEHSHYEEEPSIKPDAKRGFITQCRPQGLYMLIENFNDRQRDAVRSIGFGGLLHLSIKSYPTKMLKWLIKNFNGASRMLKIDNNRSFVVTADDVHDVFLLPRNNGTDVLKLGRNENLDLLVKLKDDYDLNAQSPLSSLKDVIQTRLTDGGDDFKRFFILYSLYSFLTPSSNRLVNLGVVKSLVHVERISDYDWCTYILKKLCKAVHKYNTNPLLKNVNGCVLLLQILYLHKLKWHGIAEPCTLPLIQHWTNERIRSRIKEESAAGDYGQGEWVIGTYPVSLNGKTMVEEKEHRSSVLVEEMNEIQVVSDGFNESGSRFIKYELPTNKLDNFEIRKIAKDEVHETLLLLKRDISVVSDYHMMNLLTKKKTIMEKKDARSSQSHVLSDGQNFFSNPRFQKYIDEVFENFEIVKKLTEEMPTFDLLTPDHGQDAEDENGKGAGEEETNGGFSIEGGEANLSGVGSEDFWLNNEEIGYLSKLINSNKNVLFGFDRQQKEIVDYCLFVDETLSKEEKLFRCGRICTVSKEDILSLSQLNEIFISVIDAWSLSINNEEAIEKKHRRFCFSLSQSLVCVDYDLDIAKVGMRSCWNSWLSQNSSDLNLVEMIFVPFRLNNHVVAVVINFCEQKIQYLDNWKYDDSENSFFQAAQIVYNEMAMFLKENNHVKADEILKYEIENVAFNWQTKKRDVDSGVYLMHHMKYFEGVLYSSPNLFKADIRRVIRAEICATIVLSEVNELRFDVLSRVFDFYKKKAEMIALKRDEAENKKKKKQKK